MSVKFTPVFNRKNHLNEHGEAPLDIIAYENRKRKYISTKIFISPNQWDSKRLEINKKHPQADIFNSQIKKIIADFEKAQWEHQLKNKPFSLNSLVELKKNNGSFNEFIKNEIANNQILAPKTIVSHNNTLNKLLDFKNGDILFSDIDYSFVDDFMNFLRKQGLAQNTIHKQHKNLKKYIDLAIKKGCYDQPNPCKDLKVRPEQKKREVLSWDEIKAIEDLDLSKFDERINIVRDIFLFACYTGLRISDATYLKPDYVKKDKDGYSLDFITIKVNKRAELPLHSLFRVPGATLSRPEMLLEKYYDKKKEFVFPKLPEPYINRHLKLIADGAKIPIKVTFHTGRHFFGTYMAGKIPLPQLMYLMQHSDIKTTMIYVNMNQQLVKEGLMKVDWEQ